MIKKLLTIIAVLCTALAFGQETYNPEDQAPINKPWGQAQAVPLDARSYFYDRGLFKYRPFRSEAEANAFFSNTWGNDI